MRSGRVTLLSISEQGAAEPGAVLHQRERDGGRVHSRGKAG